MSDWVKTYGDHYFNNCGKYRGVEVVHKYPPVKPIVKSSGGKK